MFRWSPATWPGAPRSAVTGGGVGDPGIQAGTFVVLTALDVEYEAARAHLVALRTQRHSGGTVFEVGRLGGTPWRVALAELGEGNQAAAVLTERAIALFAPRAVAFVGVAGALGSGVGLGDVVVATHVYAYHGGKEEDGGFGSRPRVWPVRQEIDQVARLVRRSGSWAAGLPVPPGDTPPAVHLRPVAAGDVVLGPDESPLRRRLRRDYQDAAAIETESAGVAQAAHLNAALPTLIVRGISEPADGHPDDATAADRRATASRHAAAFAFRVLEELFAHETDAAHESSGAPPRPPLPQHAGTPRIRGAPAAPPVPPSDTPTADHRQLVRWSKRFADDVNTVDSDRTSADGGAPSRLSGGLYVRRAVQDRVVEILRGGDPAPVLVTGEAGHGKSSLLWGVAQDLAAFEGLEAFLVNAAWLLHPAGHGGGAPMLAPSAVVSGAAHAYGRGRTPVVLLDTADLLLHDDRHEMVLLDLCEDLGAAGVRVVLTSRPEEAKRLRAGFTRILLGPYDDEEIPQAIRGHAAFFCPDAVPRDDEARVRRLLGPVARGLPVREVCRSPLHLRLLFELAQDDAAFPSAEIDVTGLYRRYWEHRVVTDRRHSGRPGTAEPDDLSATTGAIAVGLMSSGSTQLSREDLIERLTAPHSAHGLGQSRDPARLRAAVDQLLYRGVLVGDAADGVRFFHQTMFEYAAARGLLHHNGPRALEWLCAWMEGNPRDFFVSAILEQVLMLAAGSGRYRDAVRRTLARMAAHADALVLHTVAVAVAARNPAVGLPVGALLENAPHAVARRYAVLAPTARETDLDALLPQLRGLWERGEASLQLAVLEALERLAAQDTAAVQRALAEWRCVRELTGHRASTVGIDVLPRLLVLTADVDAAAARRGLMELCDFALSHALTELASAVVTLWARHWRVLGSPREALALQERIARVRPAPKSRDADILPSALAHVLAASWTEDRGLPGEEPGADAASHPWLCLLRRTAARLEADHSDTAGHAELIATAMVLTRLPGGHWAVEATLDQCLGMRGQAAPHTLQRIAFPLLLSSECAAADALVARLGAMLRALPCLGNRHLTPAKRWASVAREILGQRGVPAHRVRQALEASGWGPASDLWLRADGLAALLLPAALAGHPPAVGVMGDAVTAAVEARRVIRRGLHSAATDAGLSDGPGLELLVRLALMDADTVLLEALVTGRAKRDTGPLPPLTHERVLAALRAARPALTGLIDAELAADGGGKQQRQALVLWECAVLAGVLPPPSVGRVLPLYDGLSDQKARAAFLGLVGTTAARDPGQYAEARRFLAGLVFTPEGGVRPLDGVAGSTGNAARKALLYAACEAGPLTAAEVDTALRLAFVPPTDAGLVSGLGQLVRRLTAAQGPAPACELLIRVIRAAVASGLGRAAENHLAKALRGAMDSIFDQGSVSANRRLWDHFPEPDPQGDPEGFCFPERYAMGLVASAGRRSYDATREALEGLLVHPRVPGSTKKWIGDELGRRSRERAAHDLGWVLAETGPPGARVP